MKFAVAFAFSDPREYVEMARAADAAGWDAIAVSDHVLHPERIDTRYPYTKDGALRWDAATPWPDPWVAIGAMAAATRRVRFLTNVFVLPMRNPFVVAKAVATAAVMSGGRVALGIGVGWMREEFELLGADFRTRGARADEMIEVLRKLWAGGVVEHHGRFYDFPPLRMAPAPPVRIPIYVGGTSDAAFARAARLGDGWISDVHTVAEFREISARLRALRAAHGRAEQPFEIFGSCSDAFDADGYRRLEQAGVTHLLTQPWLFYTGASLALQDKLDGLRRFADDVIAKPR
jgi:probable F420-dependent oxidoreductase